MSIQQKKDRRIGAVLVRQGVLTEAQVTRILESQKDDPRPFGQVAKGMFNISEEAIWKAWAVQMMSYLGSVDIAGVRPEERVLSLLRAQQAWAMCCLPLRLENDCLVVATIAEKLPEAAAFFHVRSDLFVEFVLAEQVQIEQAIMQNYPKLSRTSQETHINL